MKKIIGRCLLGLFLAAAVIWIVDLAVWLVRGRPTGTVQVSWFAVANLKGGKQEFYPDGNGPLTCAQAVFPRGSANPCWYVSRHPQVFEQ